MPKPAPWYVDFCREDCDTKACVDAGRCADVDTLDLIDDDWHAPWDLSIQLLRLGRPIETVPVAGDVL